MTTCKKITLTAAAMVLSAGLAVGGTLAYLNAVTETKTNTFTSSRNITTTLTETEWTSDSGKNYLPGDVIKKNPVMNNESDQPVYMAVKVDYLDDKGNLMSAEEFKKYASITDYDNDNWKMATVNSDGSEVWIYMTAVEAGESTEALFNNVTVNAGITEEWSSAAKTTTIYKCDADGNKLSIIDTTKEQYDPTVIYKDADGNIVSAGTLPTFNIKVTGFAVQASIFADYNETQPDCARSDTRALTVETQKSLKFVKDMHGVRFDAYVKSENTWAEMGRRVPRAKALHSWHETCLASA